MLYEKKKENYKLIKLINKRKKFKFKNLFSKYMQIIILIYILKTKSFQKIIKF